MNPKKVSERNGKARKIMKAEENRKYLSDNYLFELGVSSEISKTGLLEVFRIKSCSTKKPHFIGRWDEKTDLLDIDIHGCSIIHKMYFKRGKGGYCGHHTRLIKGNKRTFSICIETPQEKIYEGSVSFGLFRDLELSDTIKITDTFSHRVIISFWKRFFSALNNFF